MSEVRIRIPRPAAVELAARYRARAEAERRLVDYLTGVVLMRGVQPRDVIGFDDARGELIIEQPEPAV